MSHTTTIQCEILDLDAAEQTCRRLEIAFCRDRHVHVGYDVIDGRAQDIRAEHAIQVPDVKPLLGLVRREAKRGGTAWALAYDGDYRTLFESHLGPNLQRFTQRYAAEVSRRAAMRAGHSVTESVAQDGSIVLRCQVNG